ncbi:MAG: hypothetical protein Q8P11_00155 [bacterium]|nr:hypothetical protein [bacterium]
MSEKSTTEKTTSTTEKNRMTKNGVKKSAPGFSVGQNINLIPRNKEDAVRSTQRSVLEHFLISAFLAVGVIAVAYGGLYYYGYTKEQEIVSVKKEIATIEHSIAVIEDHRSQLVQFQNTLEKVKNLLSNHTHWTRFFSELETYTLPDVTFTNVVLSPQGKVRLSGISKDYTTLARQMKAFEDASDIFTQVSIPAGHAILSQSGSTIGVSFDASLTLAPSVLVSIMK